MTNETLSACHSSGTSGHLGVAKTSEKTKQKYYWPGLQKDKRLFASRCSERQKRSGPPKSIIVHWWKGKLVILLTTLELISLDICHCQMETDIPSSLEITLQNGTKQYHYQIKQLLQLQMLELIIGSAALVVHIAFIVISDETSNKSLLNN